MAEALVPLHRSFGTVNRWLVLPAFRAGLGVLFSTPFTGSVMVLRTMGRRSGKRREAPLGYWIRDGAVYCCAGFGPRTAWYLNLVADPHVEVVLPTAAFAGIAETVTDEEEWRRVFPDYLRSLGLIGRSTLGDVRNASPETLARIRATLPLVRIRPIGIAPGPADPGGWRWVLVQLAWIMVLARLGRAIASRVRWVSPKRGADGERASGRTTPRWPARHRAGAGPGADPRRPARSRA
jgi:deazaflavin-dependent oxidoreductase (nitroreductase family)